MSNNAFEKLLIGRKVRVNHPSTCLNPSGRNFFDIAEYRIQDNNLYIRGRDTMWFDLNMIKEFEE